MKKLIFFGIFLILGVIHCSSTGLLEVIASEEEIVSFLRRKTLLLKNSSCLDSLVDSAAEKKVVLLGEASHGTSEYYLWRKKISRRLIEEKGFSFIVVEGDWPGCFKVNLYVKGLIEADSVEELLRDSYKRWPRWMWANQEVVELVEWLRQYNAGLPLEQRAGFYGMDVYSLSESAQEVKNYLKKFDCPELSELKENYRCFEPFGYDGFSYAQAFFSQGYDCRGSVREVVEVLRDRFDELDGEDFYAYFDLKMNAIAVKNAERYYRSALIRGPQGWNNRVYHMEGVLHRLLDFYGENSKGIVWAHNTHVGDARATSMRQDGQVNIGQLSREAFGRDSVFIVGFGTYKGKVIAGRSWGSRFEVMRVPSAQEGSLEHILAQVEKEPFLLFLDQETRRDKYFKQPYGHRAIGVVYNPRIEHLGNYVPTLFLDRYDAFIFFRNTSALSPLGQE